MIRRFAELPGWTFEIEEISAGVYRASATDEEGRHTEMTGADPDALLEACQRWVEAQEA